MSRNQTPGTLSTALVVIVLLASALGAWAGSMYKTLYKFKGGTDGNGPFGGLIFDAAGNLYGTTLEGGANGAGAIFKLTPNSKGSWTESVLYSFCSLADCSDGYLPRGNLIFDGAGSLYGTTVAGGASGAQSGGTVFKLTANSDGTWTESVLYSFCLGCDDGYSPVDGVIFDQTGNLYGTTAAGGRNKSCYLGCGVVFELKPNVNGSWTESVLHSFSGRDGQTPRGPLIFDQSGNLYGTTNYGGDLRCSSYGGCGVVFQLTLNTSGSWREHVLHVFRGHDGFTPVNGITFDTAGNLYGATESGGGNSGCYDDLGCGVVFQLILRANGSWKERVLHRFTGGKDGGNPGAALILDGAGNIYGTTVAGGSLNCSGLSSGCGLVFTLAPNANGAWKETVLHAFHDHPGTNPQSGVVFDAAGTLYGTTAGDGKTSFGSVFEITP
jgi:uncharacterized repeat protein (TIGR03803 family)